MELTDYVRYATAVALKMSRDSEMESIANLAAWRAYESYREPDAKTGNHTEEGWIAHVVKQHVWGYWREQHLTKKRNNLPTDGWWEVVVAVEDDPITEDEVCSQDDWQLLCERYIEGWPLDVVARRHNVSTCYVKKLIAAALQRFTDGMSKLGYEVFSS